MRAGEPNDNDDDDDDTDDTDRRIVSHRAHSHAARRAAHDGSRRGDHDSVEPFVVGEEPRASPPRHRRPELPPRVWQSQVLRGRAKLFGRWVSFAWLSAYLLLLTWLISPRFPAALLLDRPVQLFLLLLLVTDVGWGIQWLFGPRGGGASAYVPSRSDAQCIEQKCALGDARPALARDRGWRSLAAWWVRVGASIPVALVCVLLADSMAPTAAAAASSTIAAPVLTALAAGIACAIVAADVAHPSAKYGGNFGVVSRAAFGHRGARGAGLLKALVALVMFAVASAVSASCACQLARVWMPAPSGVVPVFSPWRWLPRLASLSVYAAQLVLLERGAAGELQQREDEQQQQRSAAGPVLTPDMRALSVGRRYAAPVLVVAALASGAVMAAQTPFPHGGSSGGGGGVSSAVKAGSSAVSASSALASLYAVVRQAAMSGAFAPSTLMPATSLLLGAACVGLFAYGDVAKASRNQVQQLSGVTLGLVPTLAVLTALAAVTAGGLRATNGGVLRALTASPTALFFARAAPPLSIRQRALLSIPLAFVVAAGLLRNVPAYLQPVRASLDAVVGRGFAARVATRALALVATLCAMVTSTFSPSMRITATATMASGGGISRTLLHPPTLRYLVFPLVAALTGPLLGIVVADYFLLRRTSLRFRGLYREYDSPYWYGDKGAGVNRTAFVAYLFALLPGAMGVAQALGLAWRYGGGHSARGGAALLDSSRWVPALVHAMWESSFFTGFAAAVAMYYVLSVLQRKWYVGFALLLRSVFLGRQRQQQQQQQRRQQKR